MYAGFAGTNGLKFLKQYKEYQLKPVVLGNPTAVDEGILRTMGDEALGVYSASWYSAGIDTPDNQRFVKAIQTEYKVNPGFYTAGTYTAGLFLEQALKTVNGRFEDKPAFLRALHTAKLTSGTNVTQFWTYEAKAFLAMPAYSRESPAARNLE